MRQISASIISTLILTAALSTKGQESHTNVAIKGVYIQSRESNINDLVFSGPGVGVELYRNLIRKNHILSFGLNGSVSQPKTKIETTRKSLQVVGGLRFDYLQKIKTADTEHLYLGAALEANYRIALYRNFDQGHFYWNTFDGLAVSSRYSRNAGKNFRIKGAFSLPVLGMVSRPDTFRGTKSDDESASSIIRLVNSQFKFATFNRQLNPKIKLELQSLRSPKLSPSLFYNFEYLSGSTSSSKKYEEIQQALGINLTF